jgi:hypothetical protein
MKPLFKMSLIIVFVISCSPVVMAQSVAEYYPLKTGSEWTLEGSGTDPTDPTITYKVIGTEKFGSSVYAKIECKLISQGHKGISLYYERCEKNRIYRLEPGKKEELFLDFSSEINQGWGTITHDPKGREGYRTGRIIGRDMTVRVPAGEFKNCIMCEITDSKKDKDGISTSYSILWFAPGTGLVKYSLNLGGGAAGPLDMWVNNLKSYIVPDK